MSPLTKLAYQQIRADRKEQIIAAARKVFAMKGFSATVTDDIASEAKVSKGLLYHYFDSKEMIFKAVIQQIMEGALMLIRDALALPGTPWDRLHWLVTEVVAHAQQNPEAIMIIVQAYISQAIPQDIHAIAVQYTAASSQAIRELIVEGQAAKQVITGNPDQLAETFTACLQGLALSAASPINLGSSLLDVDIVLRMLRA